MRSSRSRGVPCRTLTLTTTSAKIVSHKNPFFHPWLKLFVPICDLFKDFLHLVSVRLSEPALESFGLRISFIQSMERHLHHGAISIVDLSSIITLSSCIVRIPAVPSHFVRDLSAVWVGRWCRGGVWGRCVIVGFLNSQIRYLTALEQHQRRGGQRAGTYQQYQGDHTSMTTHSAMGEATVTVATIKEHIKAVLERPIVTVSLETFHKAAVVILGRG
jgi:hypothetical protein